MIKILSSKQIRELDSFTIQHEPIASIDLMERACKAFVTWFVQHIDATRSVGVICGTGNNGGDGLGIARLLQDWGYSVEVVVLYGGAPESKDFLENFSRVPANIQITSWKTDADKKWFENKDVVIDAIFGSGLSRAPEGIYKQTIELINSSSATRIAVDVPSGLSTDTNIPGTIVRADYTITFQQPKLSYFLPQSNIYTGNWISVDIGLSREFLRELKTDHHWITVKDASRILRNRKKFDHKGIYGHALVIAGSHGKIGAAVLCTRAALRSGVGLVTTHVPSCGYSILQIAVPEAMVSVDQDEKLVTEYPVLEKFSTIAVGPGLGQDSKTSAMLKNIFREFKLPVVIDADALNLLARDKSILSTVPKGSILTPHPKEFERLVGKWTDDFDRLEKQKQLSKDIQSIVVLKGAYSSITLPSGGVFFNSTGNPGMATGGTGDVLTGILAGLLAQNYSPEEAAFLGVYLHGLAGDKAKVEKGMDSLIATDLLDFLPQAFLHIKTAKK